MLFGKLSRFRLHRAHLKRLHSSTQPLPHAITVNHDRINLLDSPNDYLNSILKLIDRSTQKITLSALYFGTGEPERQIIAAIHLALSDKKRPNLTCTCIFDFSRTTRPSECNDKNSNLDIFQPLLEAFGERMRLLLYKMPERLGIFNFLIPTQLSEVLGVYHCKFCVFDQTVILTGANMSSEYLIDRQDRYMLIEQDPNNNNGMDNKHAEESESELTIFLDAFVKILDPYCCHVTHTDKTLKYLDRNSYLNIAEPACRIEKLRNTLGSEMNNLLQRKGSKKEKEREILGSQESMTMTSFHPLVQHSKCGVFSESNHLCNLLFPPTAPVLSSTSPSRPPTLHTPSRPLGYLKDITEPISENIPLECSVASNEFDSRNRNRNSGQWSKMVIASPYPSFLPHFMSSLLSASASYSNDNNSNDNDDNNNDNNNNNKNDNNDNDNNNNLIKEGCRTKFIIADEKAHGFYKGKGVKQLIPKMHTHAFQTVLKNSKKIMKKNSHVKNYSSALSASTSIDIDDYSSVYDNVSICPYHRAGWTFHVKGIWLFATQLPAPLPPLLPHSKSTASTSIHTPSSLTSTTVTTSYPLPDNTTNPVESGYFRPLAATYIGSSNLGERSCFRDFELGFVLRTNCPIFTKKLSEECSRIEEHSSELSVGFNEYVKGLKNAAWYTPYLTKLLRSFL